MANDTLIQNPANTLFRLFASVQLAVVLLLALIVIFATGTVIESMHGTEAARLLVYDTPWLTAVLVLLGLNVTVSAFSRVPWKRKHVGFVLTHSGILLILTGAVVTRYTVLDATMPIEEGSSEYRVTLDQPVLYLARAEGETPVPFAMKKRAFGWQGRARLRAVAAPVEFPRIWLLSHYPKARVHERLAEAETGPAALRVALANSFVRQEHWLIQDHENLGVVEIGPARLRFTDTFLSEGVSAPPEAGYLEFQLGKQILRLPLEKNASPPIPFELEGTPYRALVTELFKKAALVDGKLVEWHEEEGGAGGQKEGENPAAVLFLEGEGVREKHTVFARFPDFPTQHGLAPSRTGVKIYYRLQEAGSRGATHELRFIRQADELFYQVLDGFQVKRGEVAVGEKVSTGWMDLEFQVDDFFPHAKIERHFTPEPNLSEAKGVLPAIQIELEAGSQSRSLWLAEEVPEIFELAGSRYQILFGRKTLPVGFRLHLKDFRVEHYPGTEQPSSFESDVVLQDDTRGTERPATISMNEPLVYRGVRVFQASYSRSPGQPDVSIFSVGRDPGIGLKYFGTVVMVGGILTMFYTRRFSSSKEITLSQQNLGTGP